MIQLRILGALELTSSDARALGTVVTQPRRTALLCYLAVASARGFLRRDSVLALFWPEQDDEQARHALRQSLYFLRRTLGSSTIVSRGDDELAIATDHLQCDTTGFERALDERRPEDALAIYRGDLLPGFHVSDAPEFERWLDGERSRLRRRAADAAWLLAETREQHGDPRGAAEWGRRALGFSSGDELALRRFLTLLDRLGDRAAAVRAYEAFARESEREYELAPSEETRALLAKIRAERRVHMVDSVHRPAMSEPPSHELQAGVDSATAAAPEVDALPADARQAPPVAPSSGSPWGRRSSGAGVAAAAILALLGIGAWKLGALSEPVSATQPQRTVVADFASPPNDSTLGDLVAHVLNSELARSPLLRVAGGPSIADALRRMRQPPAARLSADIAREVATREQINLVVEGDVRSTSAGLILTASVVETASGDVIAGASENARDSTEVLAAIKRLSDRIRQGIGESQASIRATDRVWRFTTTSLPALRMHMAGSQAWWRGDSRMAAELLEGATKLDPEFAHAYLVLSGALDASGAPRGRSLRAIVRAYELRDRLSDRERHAVEGQYHLSVTGDLTSAIAALRKHIDALRQLPRGEPGLYGSLGTALVLAGDAAGAERVLQEARDRHPTPANLTLLIRLLYAQRRDAEAGEVLDELTRRQPQHPNSVMLRARILADSGRYDDAHALAVQFRRGGNVLADAELEPELDATRGRLVEAIDHLRKLRDAALTRGEIGPALEIAAAIGRLRLVTGDSAAVTEVDNFLTRHPINSLEALSRPSLPIALFFADAGQPRRARAWLTAYEREVAPQFQGPDRWILHRARAAVHRAEGNLDQALVELRESMRYPALHAGLFDEPSIRMTDHPELARIYDALGASDSAIAVYERYVGVRSLTRLRTDAFELGKALERLGALYEQRGDSARAADRYGRLAALWRGADEALEHRASSASRHTAVRPE
jgi:DNA-binding SARP family transcriptional activator/Flp pilus assembly protein TadD/TolB-like protein